MTVMETLKSSQNGTESAGSIRSVVGRPSLRAGVGLVDFLYPGRLAECFAFTCV